jgi:hypothetical protein
MAKGSSITRSQTTFHLTDEEKWRVASLSKRAGLTQSVLVGRLRQNAKIEPKPNPEIRDLVRSVERIGNEVHQIMHLAGQTGQITKEQIANTEQLIREIKAEVRKWL